MGQSTPFSPAVAVSRTGKGDGVHIPSHTAATATAASSAKSEAFCPVLFPRCLKTWLFASECETNAESDCFCRNEQFILGVAGCIGSWSTSPSDSQAAVACLMGICAPYITENAAIVTAEPVKSNLPIQVPGLVCADDGGQEVASRHRCTTVTYSPTRANWTGQAVSLSEQSPASNRARSTDSHTTLTIPLISLGTSTITSAHNPPFTPRPTSNPSTSTSAFPVWTPFSYHPYNASTTGSSGGTGPVSGTGKLSAGTVPIQTAIPIVGAATTPETHLVGILLAMLALPIGW